MPRHIGLVEQGMEAQAAISRCRRDLAPVYAAAIASGNLAAISEAHALATSLRIAGLQARRLTGIAEGLVTCADGLLEPGHGSAA